MRSVPPVRRKRVDSRELKIKILDILASRANARRVCRSTWWKKKETYGNSERLARELYVHKEEGKKKGGYHDAARPLENGVSSESWRFECHDSVAFRVVSAIPRARGDA